MKKQSINEKLESSWELSEVKISMDRPTLKNYYKKYHLPYDEKLAMDGEKYFAQCQPKNVK